MTDGETKQMFAAMLEIKKLNSAEALKQVKSMVVELHRAKANQAAQTMGWFVGQKVKMKPEHHNRKPYDAIGKIVKVNPKKLKVKFEGDYRFWNIPKTMIDSVI